MSHDWSIVVYKTMHKGSREGSNEKEEFPSKTWMFKCSSAEHLDYRLIKAAVGLKLGMYLNMPF